MSKKNWYEMNEKGSYLGIAILAGLFRIGGRIMVLPALAVVVFFYFITSFSARASSLQFLRQIHHFCGDKTPFNTCPGYRKSWQHFWSFGTAILDRWAVWMGRLSVESLSYSNADKFLSLLKEKKGGVIITSHLGNTEVSQCFGALFKGVPLTILVYYRHSETFNRALSKVASNQSIKLMQVTEMTPAVAMTLKQDADEGRFVVIVGDRVPVKNRKRVEKIPFLGKEADFAQGPFILAHLLECPVLMMLCMKQERGYHLYFEEITECLTFGKGERKAALRKAMTTYVKWLEYYACKYPLQWFNFYNYWR